MRLAIFCILAITVLATSIYCGEHPPIGVVDAQEASRAKAPPLAEAITEEDVKRQIVMIKCKIGDEESFGAGIIFGLTGSQLYIATANHVVRQAAQEAQTLRVQFRWMPGQWKAAELLDVADRSLDLAVLLINVGTAGVQTDILRWDLLGSPGSLKRADSMHSCGYPQGQPWHINVTPDHFSRNFGNFIFFESVLIAPGNSGGALLNENREIMGMIIDFEPPNGRAVSIQNVADTLKYWNIPVNLRHLQLATSSSAPPSTPSQTPSSRMGPLQDGLAYLQADLYSRRTASAEECSNLCAADSQCKAMTFIKSQGLCWIKGAVPQSASTSDMVSAVKVEMGPLEPGISFNGGDIYDRPAASAEACANLCANEDRCRAVTFIISQQRCWLKDRVNPSAQSNDMISARKQPY